MECKSNDSFLISKLQRGNREALHGIYDKYNRFLISVVVNLGNDVATAEDIAHDVFTSLATDVWDLKLRSTLRAYLATCAANRARDRARKEATHTAHLNDMATRSCGEGNPIKSAIDREDFKRFQAALARLPYEQREVVFLHVQGEMTFRQIAEAQPRMSINTVKSRWRRAIQTLQEQLNITPAEQED